MSEWQVQPRTVCAGDACRGVANQWWVSLAGYLWCVSEDTKGKKTCTCAQKAGCPHVKATEDNQ